MDPPLETDKDTLVLAQAVRKSQGSFEMEVTCGDEADLHRSYADCPKNPGHDKFVPVGEFCLDHLPAQYQDPDIVELVKAHAALVVLVRVNCISDKRPDVHPSTGEPYPLIKFRGRTGVGRTGTGFIMLVSDYKESENCPCKCVTCVTSGHRAKVWGEIFIETAAHVVFDKQECDHTKCLLFYDSGDAKLSDLLTLEPLLCFRTDVNEDKIVMRYVTHDMELIDRLTKMTNHYVKQSRSVFDKYKKISCQPLPTLPDDYSNTDNKHNLVVMISHPHGCSKMVTVGVWTDREEHYPRATQYFYNAATCHGSSGARVYFLGTKMTGVFKHLHKGSCVTPGLNCSGIAEDDNIREYHVKVPYSKFHLVFGAGRKKLKKIQKKANVYIKVDQDFKTECLHTDLATTPDCTLSIEGLQKNAQRAKTMVEELMIQTDDSLADLSRVEEIVIPASKVRLIFSHYGEKLKRLKTSVGMYVIGDVNATPATDVKLCIFGQAPTIQRTKQVIKDLLAQGDDQDSDSDSDCEVVAITVDRISDLEESSDEEDETGNKQNISFPNTSDTDSTRNSTDLNVTKTNED